MDRTRQISQIATLAREHLLACAYRLHSEAGVKLGRKQNRTKVLILEAIVNILRHSLVSNRGVLLFQNHTAFFCVCD